MKVTKCLKMQERAQKRIPGMTQLLSKRPDQFSKGVWPAYYEKAKGAVVWDLDGNRYVDMSIGGIGATVLGYSDPDVDRAVLQAVKKGSSSSLNCPEEVELADLLCKLHPWAEQVRYARSGGESMAIAVRIARAFTGRDKVAFCGYHGWHDWYLSANLGTENALGEHLLPGLSPAGVPRGLSGTALPFRFNQIQELKSIIAKNSRQIAAVIMEPIRNEAPENGFLEKVKKLAHRAGAVLIFDEISSGFRLNTGGAHMILGTTPDIAVFSKALGNGYPISAIIGRGEVMESAQQSFISSTNWTERIGPAAAIATVLKYQRLNVSNHLMKIGTSVQNGWQKASRRTGIEIEVGGIPPLSHFLFLDKDHLVLKALFVQLMLERGFLASTIFYSMYAHTKENVKSYLEAVQEAFSEIANLRRNGNVRAALKGRSATAGFKRLN